MASIDDFDLTDSYDMPLRHRVTKEPLYDDKGDPLFIKVTNTDSPQFRKLKAHYRNDELRGVKTQNADSEEAKLTNLMVECTLDWHLVDAKGPIKFTPKAARDIYSDPRYSWIRSQVVVAVFDEANFVGESLAA